jgi:hypothetical protein
LGPALTVDTGILKVRMKGLTSTAASRAWLGVALVGLAVAALVLALSLIPRLSAGQRVIDAAKPAFADQRVAGTRAGVSMLSQYVDLVDPLMTARGGGYGDVRAFVRLIGRRMGLSSAQVRKILHREAPHTEALMRALPLTGVADEVSRLTAYLAKALTVSEDELAATFEQDYPHLTELLTTLPDVTDSWYDVPGIDGLTRVGRGKPVRTVPGLRKYLRDDLVPLTADHKEHFQRLAGRGGIGYIPKLLLLAGLALFGYGLLQARRATVTAPGRRSWSFIVAGGALLVALVIGGQLFPRLGGGQKLISDFEPVFAQKRVKAVTIGMDTLHDAIGFADPIMTPGGGAAAETPRLYSVVADRTGRKPGAVRRALSRRVPRTVALFDALPLTKVAAEVPRLLRYLSRALHLPQAKLVARLRRHAPALTQALLTAPPVTAGWTAMPGTGDLTRFDDITPVRTMPALDDYLREDVIALLNEQRQSFDRLASGTPQLRTLAPALLILGLVLMVYGAVMRQLVGRRY